MAENIRMDSHKLMYHPEIVARWLNGENIYPIEMEISLSSGCNHRCVFCSFEYMNHAPVFLGAEVLLSNLKQLAPKGLKSIVYAGDGEPLLHSEAVNIINETKGYGIDVAMSTNGVLLTPELSRNCLCSLSWLRFSVAGITDATYDKIQRGKPGDLEKVLFNLESAVKVKKDQGLKTTIGVQILLLPDNKDEIVQMGKELKKIGVDYFTIKPFMQHPQNSHLIQVEYGDMQELGKEVKTLEEENFKIYFRSNAMKNINCERGYTKCWGLPFMAYLNAAGDIYSCVRILGRDELKYGNIYEQSFCDIWEGDQRKKATDYLMNMDLEKNCGKTCRMNEINKYLEELKYPSEHVNFI